MGVDNAMRHKHKLADRKDDLYETPDVATHALCDAVYLPARIWEPACGRGAIARVLAARGHDVVATDLVDYGYGAGKRDFLMEMAPPPGVSCIVTNPPYKLAAPFVRHALFLCPHVFMLLRLAFLEAGTRCEARRAVLDDGQLASVSVFANRLPMMHRDGWDGPKANSGAAFAWFEWRRDFSGDATLRRLWWRELKETA